MKLFDKIAIGFGVFWLVLAFVLTAIFSWVQSSLPQPLTAEEVTRMQEEAQRRAATDHAPKVRYEPDQKLAHPGAQKLMKEKFYWDILDENSPFGNDDGADALPYWRRWRKTNPDGDPATCVANLLQSWGISFLDWERKGGSVNPFDWSGTLANEMGNNGVIGVAFGQLIDEGYVAPDLVAMARRAISNEMNFALFKRLGNSEERKRRLAMMKDVLDQAPQAPSKSEK